MAEYVWVMLSEVEGVTKALISSLNIGAPYIYTSTPLIYFIPLCILAFLLLRTD